MTHPFQSWGAEGYHLWVLPNKQERRRQEEQQQQQHQQQQEEGVVEEEEEEMVTPPPSSLQAGILQFHFIKSALTVNPCTVRGNTSSVFVNTHIQTHTLNIHAPFAPLSAAQSNQEQVLLHGEDRLYLTCGDPTQVNNTSDTHPHTHLHPHDGSPLHHSPNPDSSLSQGLSTLLGHKHWHVVQVRMHSRLTSSCNVDKSF